MQLFVVFHKKIFDDNYKFISDELLNKYFTFIAVNPKIEKDYSANKRKYKIINEWELGIYDSTFQERGYNENSAIYHVYANKLHEKYNYIGFFQYDMVFEVNIVSFLLEDIANIESGKTKPLHYLEEHYNYKVNNGQKLFIKNKTSNTLIQPNTTNINNIQQFQLTHQDSGLTQKQLKFKQLEQQSIKFKQDQAQAQNQALIEERRRMSLIENKKSPAEIETEQIAEKVKILYNENKAKKTLHETKSNMTNTYFYYENFNYPFSIYENWNEMPTIEFIIKDFEQYFKIPFDKTKIFPLYNCYVITTDLYNKIMPWVIQLYTKLYPWCVKPPNSTAFPHIGFIYERIMGYAVGQLCEYSIRMRIKHLTALKTFVY